MTAEISTTRITRKLTAAEGYLELGLPELALEELQRIENPGPFSVPCLYMAGEALKRLERYDEAIAPLRQAACSLPVPLNAVVWRSVAECLQKSGLDRSSRDASETAQMLNQSADQMSGTPQSRTVNLAIPHFGNVTLTIGHNGPSSILTISVEPTGRGTDGPPR